jgi:hypothetical protein
MVLPLRRCAEAGTRAGGRQGRRVERSCLAADRLSEQHRRGLLRDHAHRLARRRRVELRPGRRRAANPRDQARTRPDDHRRGKQRDVSVASLRRRPDGNSLKESATFVRAAVRSRRWQ